MMLIMKKKIYEAPFAELVDVEINSVMEVTSPFGPGEGDDNGDWGDQMSKEHHGGSWNDIWGNM